MAKTSSINRNKKRIKMVKQFAEKRAALKDIAGDKKLPQEDRMAKQFAARRSKLKAMAIDDSVPPEDRFAARLKLAELPRNSSKTRIRNRCELTGRSRGYESRFKLSRIMLRELASKGQIPGMTKSSW